MQRTAGRGFLFYYCPVRRKWCYLQYHLPMFSSLQVPVPNCTADKGSYSMQHQTFLVSLRNKIKTPSECPLLTDTSWIFSWQGFDQLISSLEGMRILKHIVSEVTGYINNGYTVSQEDLHTLGQLVIYIHIYQWRGVTDCTSWAGRVRLS